MGTGGSAKMQTHYRPFPWRDLPWLSFHTVRSELDNGTNELKFIKIHSIFRHDLLLDVFYTMHGLHITKKDFLSRDQLRSWCCKAILIISFGYLFNVSFAWCCFWQNMVPCVDIHVNVQIFYFSIVVVSKIKIHLHYLLFEKLSPVYI